MRSFFHRLPIILALSFAGIVSPYNWMSQAYAASGENVERVFKMLQAEEAYVETLDALIAEMRSLNMFSGSQNKDTEELRIRLTRERVIAGQKDNLAKLRKNLDYYFSDEELDNLFSNLGPDGEIEDERAIETNDMAIKLYRDVIFNAIIGSAVPVQEQADQIKKSGGVLK